MAGGWWLVAGWWLFGCLAVWLVVVSHGRLVVPDLVQARSQSNLATTLFRVGQFRACIVQCTEALGVAVESSQVAKLLYRRGVAYQEVGESELAVTDLRDSLSVEPDNRDVVRALAKVQASVRAADMVQRQALAAAFGSRAGPVVRSDATDGFVPATPLEDVGATGTGAGRTAAMLPAPPSFLASGANTARADKEAEVSGSLRSLWSAGWDSTVTIVQWCCCFPCCCLRRMSKPKLKPQ